MASLVLSLNACGVSWAKARLMVGAGSGFILFKPFQTGFYFIFLMLIILQKKCIFAAKLVYCANAGSRGTTCSGLNPQIKIK